MGGAQRQRAFVVALGHGVQAGLADRDDGGKDHDAQQQRGGEQAHAPAVVDVQHLAHKIGAQDGLDARHQHHHAEEAVNHRRDAGQQLHGGQQHPVDALGGEPAHVDGGEQADGHPHDDGPGGDVDAAEDHGQDAVDVVGGFPVGTQQEVQRPDLEDGGHAVGEQEDADEHHGQDGHAGAEGEDPLHDVFLVQNGCLRIHSYTSLSNPEGAAARRPAGRTPRQQEAGQSACFIPVPVSMLDVPLTAGPRWWFRPGRCCRSARWSCR